MKYKIIEKLNITPLNISELADIKREIYEKSDLKTFDIVKFGSSEMLYMVFINDDIIKFYDSFLKNDGHHRNDYAFGVMFYVSDMSRIKEPSFRHQMYLNYYDEDLTYKQPSYSNWNIVEVYSKPNNEFLFNEMPVINTFDTTQIALRKYIEEHDYDKICLDNKYFIKR